MEGPFPSIHRDAVARLFGPTATINGSLGTPQRPGVVAIHVGGRELASAGTFAQAVDLAGRKASEESHPPTHKE